MAVQSDLALYWWQRSKITFGVGRIRVNNIKMIVTLFYWTENRSRRSENKKVGVASVTIIITVVSRFNEIL